MSSRHESHSARPRAISQTYQPASGSAGSAHRGHAVRASPPVVTVYLTVLRSRCRSVTSAGRMRPPHASPANGGGSDRKLPRGFGTMSTPHKAHRVGVESAVTGTGIRLLIVITRAPTGKFLKNYGERARRNTGRAEGRSKGPMERGARRS